MVEFAPPVTPAHIAVTAVPEVVAVSVTGEPLQARGVVYLYTTVPTYILFCSTDTAPVGADMFAVPFGKTLKFSVSPQSSYFVAAKAGAASGDLYWYLAGENGE